MLRKLAATVAAAGLAAACADVWGFGTLIDGGTTEGGDGSGGSRGSGGSSGVGGTSGSGGSRGSAGAGGAGGATGSGGTMTVGDQCNAIVGAFATQATQSGCGLAGDYTMLFNQDLPCCCCDAGPGCTSNVGVSACNFGNQTTLYCGATSSTASVALNACITAIGKESCPQTCALPSQCNGIPSL